MVSLDLLKIDDNISSPKPVNLEVPRPSKLPELINSKVLRPSKSPEFTASEPSRFPEPTVPRLFKLPEPENKSLKPTFKLFKEFIKLIDSSNLDKI